MLDLNADIGEGAVPRHVDVALMDVVTSANVACGFHGGDSVRMRLMSELAVKNNVRLGAHVSYWDRPGFGRRELGLGAGRAASDIAYQIGALQACATLGGGRVAYVKPHGALYTRLRHDEYMAAAVVAAVARIDISLAVMAPPGSWLAKAAVKAGLEVIAEGFADRRYHDDGSLTPRSQKDAVLVPEAAIDQAVQIIRSGCVQTSTGNVLTLKVDSICVHSDSPGALDVARAIREHLADRDSHTMGAAPRDHAETV